MIILKESAGDIKLCKFIIILSNDLINDDNENFFPNLPGYVYIEDYRYSTIEGIGTTDRPSNPWYSVSDDYVTHQAIVDMIPQEIKQTISQKEWLSGRIDYYPHSFQNIVTTVFGSKATLNPSIISFLETLSKRYNSRFDITRYTFSKLEYVV